MPEAPRILLLHGEEAFLVEEQAGSFIATTRAGLVSEFGYEPMEPGGLTAARLRDALMQAPFLDPHRLVVVRRIAPQRADGLAPAIAGVPESTRLLMTVNGRLPAASKLAKAVAAAPGGAVREMAALKSRALGDWAAQRARDLGLSPAVVAQVIRVTPPNLGIIDAELRKIAAYQAGGGTLNASVLRDLLAAGREDDVFRLTDSLLPQPSAETLQIVRRLLGSGSAPTMLAWRISRHLATVLEAKTRQERGETLTHAQAQMTGNHPFVVQKAFESARAVTAERLEAGLRALLAYEWEVKSGQIDADLGLETVLAKL